MMHMGQAVWTGIFEHALEDYPAECCGIVAEHGKISYRVHRCDNIQDRLHANDPETHPRTSRTAYRMDDLQVARIVRETEEAGGRLVGFYHSHIDCNAYFSQEDRDAATFFGEPAYPDVVYLVVSVVDGKLHGQKGFCWSKAEADFIETPLEV